MKAGQETDLEKKVFDWKTTTNPSGFAGELDRLRADILAKSKPIIASLKGNFGFKDSVLTYDSFILVSCSACIELCSLCELVAGRLHRMQIPPKTLHYADRARTQATRDITDADDFETHFSQLIYEEKDLVVQPLQARLVPRQLQAHPACSRCIAGRRPRENKYM